MENTNYIFDSLLEINNFKNGLEFAENFENRVTSQSPINVFKCLKMLIYSLLTLSY